MKRLKEGGLAGAFIIAFALGAAAQTPDWRFYRAGDSGARRPRPVRPVLVVEDSEKEREQRLEGFSKCVLLAEIKERSFLDEIAGVPNVMMDWTASFVNPPPARDGVCSMRSRDEGSVLSRVFSASLQEPSPYPFDELVNQLVLREQRYFAKFQDSSLSTVGVEDGYEDIDTDGLMADQQKLIFDAARKLYFGRLGNKVDDRLRDESLNISRWEPIDYAVAPALIAGFLYVRGWEKRFDAAGLRWAFNLEPARRILERRQGSHNDLACGASLEVGFGDFPVKAIMTVGIQDGDALIDFIGIGTSVGKAKQVVSHELDLLNPEE